MIGLLVDGLLDAVWTAGAGFFKSAERERDDWLSTPGVATYAPKIVRHHQEWPGGRRQPQPWPYQPWPGSGEGR